MDSLDRKYLLKYLFKKFLFQNCHYTIPSDFFVDLAGFLIIPCCPSVRQPARPSVRPYVQPSVRPSICLSTFHIFYVFFRTCRPNLIKVYIILCKINKLCIYKNLFSRTTTPEILTLTSKFKYIL